MAYQGYVPLSVSLIAKQRSLWLKQVYFGVWKAQLVNRMVFMRLILRMCEVNESDIRHKLIFGLPVPSERQQPHY